ncbi:MAG: SRPBCC domain-containing protein [Chitinophagaceae bacterium]|nr:SRPBCC domain-containing protein [Chitinophagaceae bacterium]
MHNSHFQFCFVTPKSKQEVFNYLKNPAHWWQGLYQEHLEGSSKEVNDSFSFTAGNGIHHSIQKLLELDIDKKISWQVIESNLTFLNDSTEWLGTRICFEIEDEGENTKVIFSHVGLVPALECYDSCSHAWTQYLEKLKTALC